MKDNSIFESDSESVGYKEKQDEKKTCIEERDFHKFEEIPFSKTVQVEDLALWAFVAFDRKTIRCCQIACL